MNGLIRALSDVIQTCNCGGVDCIFGDLQLKAARVIGRRRWREMTLLERLAVLQQEELDPEIALKADPAFNPYDGTDYLAGSLVRGDC